MVTYLWSEVHLREPVTSHERQSVRESRGRALGPAGAAVLRDVLVAVNAGVAHTLQVADVVLLGYGLSGQVRVGQRAFHNALFGACNNRCMVGLTIPCAFSKACRCAPGDLPRRGMNAWSIAAHKVGPAV